MAISKRTIEEIDRRADILALAQEYTKMTQRGYRWWGLSPFKDEKTPSFTVTPEKNLYYCFSTQKGGGVFSFIMEIEKLTFPEAAEFLAKKMGIEVVYDASHRPPPREHEDLLQLYRRVTTSFVYLLHNSPRGVEARQHLVKRGITPQTIKDRAIGYAPHNATWLYSFLRSKNYSETFLHSSGLFSSRHAHQSLFIDRVIFPIYNRDSRPIAFGGRALVDRVPKYINTPTTALFHKGSSLYGIEVAAREARRRDCIFLVEGYIDQLALWQSGRINTVAPLGTALTEKQVGLLKRLCTNVIIVFDADEAGQSATLRAIRLLLQQQITPQVCTFPEGTDPADILSQHGEKNVLNTLDTNRKSFIQFITEHFAGRDTHIHAPINNSPLAFEGIFEYISLIRSDIQRERYLYSVADSTGLSRDSVLSDYGRYMEGQTRAARPTTMQKQKLQSDTPTNRELFLMMACFSHLEEFASLRAQIDERYFKDARAKKLFAALDRSFREHTLTTDTVLQLVDDSALRGRLSRSLATNEFAKDGSELIRDGIRTLQQRFFQDERSVLIRELERRHSARTSTDQERDNQEITRLQYEIIYLNQEIQKRHNFWHNLSIKESTDSTPREE